MDSTTFDRLAKGLTMAASRRSLLERLSALPLGAALATLLSAEGEAGHRRRRRRARHHPGDKKRHRKGKGKNGKGKGKSKASCGETTDCPDGQVCAAGACAVCDVCAGGCAFTAVQAAIDAATPGDRIIICPESYGENLTIGKNLTLIGGGSAIGPDLTQIQSIAAAPVVTITAGNVSLQHLRIVGGGEPVEGDGAGIRNAGTTELIGCAVAQNTARQDGGGIFNAAGATLTLTGCNIEDNVADFGGGIANKGTATITNSTLTLNLADFGGGGLYADGGTLSLHTCTVINNEADSGGGIFSDLNSTVTLDAASRVTQNKANASEPDSGGGIFNRNGTVTLAGAQNVSGNTPDNCGGDDVPLCVNS